MNWRSHILIGAILGLAAALLLGEELFPIIIITAFSGLCALAPDLDHDSSKGRQWLDVAFVGIAFMAVYGSACGADVCVPGLGSAGSMAVTFLAMAGAYFLFFRFLKPRHRGITHTLVACFGFGVLLYLLAGSMLALAGLVGYASHLIADNELKLI
ncbi:metal-dependent hydrolase [Candidatus Micrarchaeota archaeon]|nr:metal-dependent hydrolase [Candidatus Micrarchaeota archaeon]